MKKILFLAGISLFLVSCASTKRSATTKTTDIYGAGVIQKPVIADLDVKQAKVTGTSSYAAGSNIDIAKQAAVADALKKANADVLVEPVFTTETTGSRLTVTVTGFPATYINFRSIKPEDVALLNVGVTQKANVYEPSTTTKKKTKAGLIIGAVVAGAALLGAKAAGLF